MIIKKPHYRSFPGALLKFLLLGSLLFSPAPIFAQGLNIPTGSTVNVNTGTLDVTGQIDNDGTLVVTTGTVGLTGNLDNTNGTLTAGTGTVALKGASGTQDVTTGGTAVGKRFYNLTHSGAGTARIVTNNVDVDNNFTNSAGTFNLNSLSMTVAETWANSATFSAGTGTVTLDGTTQSITGSTTFYNLTKTTAGDTLSFQNASTQTMTGTLTLQGAAGAGNLLALNSDDDDLTPTRFNITLQAGGLQAMQYLNVKNSDASGGLELVAGSTSTNSGNNVNWVFGNTTYTWDGDISTNWSVAGNWNLGAIPGPGDTVIIPSDPTSSPDNFPVLSAAVSVGNITINSGASLTLAGSNLTVTGTLTNTSGTVNLYGYETMTIASVITTSGTFAYTGDSDGVSETFTITDFGATDYYNLTINDTSGVRDTFQTNANLTVVGALTVSSGTMNISTNTNTLTVTGALAVNGANGTLTATGGNIDANGSVTVSNGVLTAPTTGQSFTIAGDLTHSGGTFTNSSGTVTLDGTNQTLTGSTTFYNLTKSTPGGNLTLDTASTQTVSNSLTLSGASGNLMNLKSSSASSQAALTLTAGGIQAITYLDVRDSNASGGVTLVGRNSTQVNGNNTNWIFGGATITWDGSSTTDWDTPANWDLGLVPNSDDTAIITDQANDPVLATNVQVENLTINASGILRLNSRNLTVDTTFTNNGTVSAFGGETLSLTQDTDSGTFTFTGDGDGTAENLTIPSFSGVDYYNLIINDPNATKDTIRSAADITAGNNLNVTSGTFDISTNASTLTTTGTLTVDGGTLTATSGNIDANGSVTISSGTLTAPGSSTTFTVADDWTKTGGTLTTSSGTVTFDNAAVTSTIAGTTTFYNLNSTTAGKTIQFTAGTTQTVNGTLNVVGTGASNIVLSSTAAASWDITFPNGAQSVSFVNVSRSNANTNTVTCFNCTDGGNNNANWLFKTLAISIPQGGTTTDTTPTVIGVADASQTVTIKDISGNTVGTTTSDTSGNFRVEVSAITAGANTLRPFIGALGGPTTSITASASPTTDQQPTITSHVDGNRINGALPTITGAGLAGQTVTIMAHDSGGNLLLQSVGTGTVNGAGTYSITVTTALPKGTNYLSTTVSGVASDILEVSLTDPFGIVFDSISNNPIRGASVSIFRASDNQLAVVGTDLASTDVNPLTTGSDGFYSFLTIPGNYYLTISAEGYSYPTAQTSFPAGRTIVTGSKGETFTVNAVVIEMDHPMDSNSNLLRITKDANKSEAHVGEVVTYTVTIENRSANNSVLNFFLEDKIPPGFKFLEDRVILDGLPIARPLGNRPLRFTIGDIGTSTTRTLKYQLVVGAGVTIGNYDNTAVARYADGLVISNYATETVKVVLDPLFDLGLALGKVFFDRNENGVQDAPEYVTLDRQTITEDPVPNARIIMENGTIVTTDQNGQFHIPDLTPGRHLFRLDERSLPDGSYLTTDKVVVVDVTPGMPFKVNFGVNLDYNRFKNDDKQFFTTKVNVYKDQSSARPRLNVSLYNDEIPVYNDIFVDKAEFKIFTNYAPFIDTWKLEIFDSDTREVIQEFEGVRYDLFDPVVWDGKDKKGETIHSDRRYEYRLFVEDSRAKFDETKALPIAFNIIKTDEELKEYKKEHLRDAIRYYNWLEAQNAINNLHVQTILVSGETVRISRLQAGEFQSVRIMKDGQLLTEIPAGGNNGLTARELMESSPEQFREAGKETPLEMILPKGKYEILIQEAQGAPARQEPGSTRDKASVTAGVKEPVKDQARPVKIYSKPIEVGENYLVFVAMGDARIGYTMTKNNIEAVRQNDQFNNGFWTQGQLAYYLKGKILGKYLITSSFDSERDRKELFKSLDPEKYYPVYGDESSLNNDATATQGNLYLLLEWDKSSAVWGNYSVDFKDTEFAQFSRTLYGGKIDYSSVATTPYGDARTRVVTFRARAQQRSAHNEFLATGGSLYYLRNTDVIEGSDRIIVEVRDKITGLVVGQKEMKEGADYELDYESGRVLFWRPVPILVDSYSIVSNKLLDGNLVYVIVDYEYETKDKVDEANTGARIQQALGDNVLVGGTYVKEAQESNDYELKGTDVTVKIGDDTTLKAEYAESVSQSTGTFISTDGGLSFADLTTQDSSQGRAYGLSGDTRLFNRLGLSSYYKWIDNDFSTASTLTQQGKEVFGFSAVYDLSDQTRLSLRHDIQTLLDDGNLQTQLQLGAKKTETTIFQIVHQIRKLTLTGEYMNQKVTDASGFVTETNQAGGAVGARAEYELNDKVILSVEQQTAVSGEMSNLTTIGARVKPTEDITVEARQSFGQDGTATTLGGTANLTERLALSGDYTMSQAAGPQAAQKTANLGATAKVDDKSSVTTKIGVLELPAGEESRTMSFGGSTQVDETTSTSSEIALTESSVDGKNTVYTFGTTKKLSDELELASTQTFGFGNASARSDEQGYRLTRNKDGRTFEGSLSRKYLDSKDEVSRTNIFGLSGDINDRWALSGSVERGDVLKIDHTTAERMAISLAGAYVNKNEETGKSVKSSTKVEVRFDEGDEDVRQFLIYNATEGKITDELTLFSKLELSRTRNVTAGTNVASHKEIVIGGAYRPIMFDRLNILGRYTYLESNSPIGQIDTADIEEQRAHVLAADAIYDINEQWQIAEKIAYRLAEEKVAGFDFTKTHTWLMIHRLNYKIDSDWLIGGEFRILTQKEARDSKRGFLVEGARRMGDLAQLGVGFNFTDFSDDLTDLGYRAYGPFVRMTGKFYDRTPEEMERDKQRWLDEKIERWAELMVDEELSKSDSPIIEELNNYFFMAARAREKGYLEVSRELYKDIITAGQMMFEEASEYIRGRINTEERLQTMKKEADQYFRNGQYEKARKILEKILEELN